MQSRNLVLAAVTVEREDVRVTVLRASADRSRPTIEFYRSRDAIDVLLPIA